MNTLARTDRRDVNYRGPILLTLEDRTYPAEFNVLTERQFRRRVLQTIVDMRGMG